MQNELGQQVIVKTMRRVRPWFFAQDGGWYVQCRYGARVIAVDGNNNAVFVKSLKEIEAVFEAFIAAAGAGEFDGAIAKVMLRQPGVKPSAARASANA